jgi:hypothetical protein
VRFWTGVSEISSDCYGCGICIGGVSLGGSELAKIRWLIIYTILNIHITQESEYSNDDIPDVI